MSEKKQTLCCSKDVAEVLFSLLHVEQVHDREKEHFWILGLKTKNVIQYADLVSLGTMFYEPLWLFCRCEAGVTIADLKGLRLSIGQPGSGGHQVALRLL